MLCSKCNATKATIHFKMTVNGAETKTEVCAKCRDVWFSASGLSSLNTFDNQGGGDDIYGAADGMRQLTPEEIEAFYFITACVNAATNINRTTHVRASEILIVAAEVATGIYGPTAQEHLIRIGLVSSRVFGELVFRFIAKGYFLKRIEDQLEDFYTSSSFDDFVQKSGAKDVTS